MTIARVRGVTAARELVGVDPPVRLVERDVVGIAPVRIASGP